MLHNAEQGGETAVRHTRMEPGAMPLERLEAEICQLAAHLDAALCRWLLLVADFHRRGG